MFLLELLILLPQGVNTVNHDLDELNLGVSQSLLGVSREINHDGSPHSSSQVSGTGVDEAVLLRQSEVLSTLFLYRFTHSLDTSDKTRKDSLDITALLHGN